ncbi:MAG: winged helix-turn-helix domain-containing protein [Candidatus Heimdallarchaeota archaeon]
MIEITRETAQKFIIEEQGLGVSNSFENVLDVAKKIHNIQIDTISVVARSHDLILFNRLENYQEKEVWKWLQEKKLFEFWSHAMCLMPFEEYPFYAWKMKYNQTSLPRYWNKWIEINQSVMDRVYLHVKKNGLTSSTDFKKENPKKSEGWWDWKVEKMALECLFLQGKLLVAYRKNFQKTFDLTENVVPAHIDTEPMGDDLLPEYLTKTILSSIGIANEEELKTYLGEAPAKYLWKRNKNAITDYLQDCVKNDILVEIQIEEDEEKQYSLKENIPKFESIINKDVKNTKVKFLTPFDNIIRERNFPAKIWNYDYKIECYVPVPKRKFGYFALPILDGYQLIGRADLKVHRAKKILEIKALEFEDGISLTDARKERLVQGFNSFAKFNGCSTVENATKISIF